MKKHLLLLLACLPMVLFTACSSDDENPTVSLNGTTWVNNEDGVRTIRFQEKTFSFTYVNAEDNESDEDGGTYTYTPPFVNFTAINRETDKVETHSGKIDGDKLTFGVLVYTKK